MEGKDDEDQDSVPAGLSALAHLLANITQCNRIWQYGVPNKDQATPASMLLEMTFPKTNKF
jgi:hypothetical protein